MAERNDLNRSPNRSTQAIRQDIAARRESISDTVDRLGTRIQEKLDWRQWVNQYPYVAIGAAAGLGLLLSGLVKTRRSPADRIRDAFGEMMEDFLEDVKRPLGNVAVQAMRPLVMKSSLGIAAAKALIELAKKKANEAPAPTTTTTGQESFAASRPYPPNTLDASRYPGEEF
jgi:hypothetical protein